MIAIVDYGVGNLYSLECSLRYIGARSVVTRDRDLIASADRIILPGVGAFGDAMKKLNDTGLTDFLKEQAEQKPFLGICLGMQMLLEKSFEYGEHTGLGLIKGRICSLSDDLPNGIKVPQMGWNGLSLVGKNPLFKYINDGDCVYFVHSYYAKDCQESTVAFTDYAIPVTAAVANKKVYGVQFHPEKSGTVGLNILKAFCEVL